jgi:putative transposase
MLARFHFDHVECQQAALDFRKTRLAAHVVFRDGHRKPLATRPAAVTFIFGRHKFPARGPSALADGGIAGLRSTNLDIGLIIPYNKAMKLTLQILLLPDAEASARLRETVERFNAGANWLAGIAFERKLANKIALQKIAYYELRERFGLPADTAVRCIAQVCEAYKRDKSKRPRFRKHAAVPFSMGKNIGFKGIDRVSISTLTGRVVVPFVMGQYQRERFGFAKGQCDLVLRDDGKWLLLVTVDIPDEPLREIGDFIGIDLGVENIAVDSGGTVHSSDRIEKVRRTQARNRATLGRAQKKARRRGKRCRQIHRAVRRTKGKESRFRRDVNHCISKRLVGLAKDTRSGIALEDLKGIRARTEKRLRRRQRARHVSWAFFQLRAFIEYKAKLAGVPAVTVDPRDTSRTCNICGHCDKRNRKSQAEFECRACGHCSHADLNAALNVRAKALVNAPKVSEHPRTVAG